MYNLSYWDLLATSGQKKIYKALLTQYKEPYADQVERALGELFDRGKTDLSYYWNDGGETRQKHKLMHIRACAAHMH